jgi:oligopeptide/dipeptide ABC transporter ATP-binding protein
MTTAPLLSVRDLHVHFSLRRGWLGRGHGAVRAVDGVSFSIAPGRSLGLVGESGSGKTTLARAVLRLIPPTSGRVQFAGRDLGGLGVAELRALRRDMQVVFQDPFGSLDPRMTVGDIIAEPLRAHGLARGRAAASRVAELLCGVGLRPEHSARYPREFSGGQRQRIAIARALATSPRLIICDEPVSALDVSVQSQIINLLSDLAGGDRSHLLISHNLAVVRQLCDEVAVLYLGRIVESGPADAIFENPCHPYTAALLGCVPRVAPPLGKLELPVLKGEPPSPTPPPRGCRFHPRCPLAEDRCRDDDPPLASRPGTRPGQSSACHFADRVGSMPRPPAERSDVA